MGDTAELLGKILASMAALLAAAKAWARLNQSSERREDRAALKQVNDALREENDRCKRDLVFEKERKDQYRKDCHDLRNEIHRLGLEKEAEARKHYEEKLELYTMLDKAHTDVTVLQLQLDAERMARHHRENTEPPREEA